MPSLFLARLNGQERADLIKRLHEAQSGKCFICEKEIDLDLHKDALDIDHVIPLKMNGPDNPSNFALTHSSCNRAKQAADLNVARILARFQQIKESVKNENRGPNLDDILLAYQGKKYSMVFKREGVKITFSFPDLGNNEIITETVYRDSLSGFEYFFAFFPIEYLHHDDKINPRSIGANIAKLIQEFYQKRPQLHVQLAWIDSKQTPTLIKVFDGQHKAAAQIMLGARFLPVRVFINPNIDMLLTANTNAGTFLKQVAFDKSIQRHLGSALYLDRIDQYIHDHNLPEETYSFSERDLLKYFKGESREVKRYILDSVRDSITHNPDNKLIDYIDFGGRGKEKPFSYSTIEKTFYSFFIFQDVLDSPLDFKLEEGENPRELEKAQILGLMNIVAEEIFIGRYDPDLGTSQIESKIQKGENIPLPHLCAYRMAREEICYNWLKLVHQVIKSYFIMQKNYIKEEKIIQYPFPEPLWEKIRMLVRNLRNLPVWSNKQLSSTVFGGKQNNEYWQLIFETGKSPQGIPVLGEPVNIMKMIMEQ